MNLSDEDRGFLRDLVKVSRQKLHHLKWVDRDGTARVTTFSQPEAVRINALARSLGIGQAELLRQASHLPVAKSVDRPPEI